MPQNEQKKDENIFFDNYKFNNEKFLKHVKNSKEFDNLINMIDANTKYLGNGLLTKNLTNELFYKNLSIILSYSKSTETGIVITNLIFAIISACFSLLAIIISLFSNKNITNEGFVLFSIIILTIAIFYLFKKLELRIDNKISFSYNYLIKCIELKLDNCNMDEYKEGDFFLIRVKEIKTNR